MWLRRRIRLGKIQTYSLITEGRKTGIELKAILQLRNITYVTASSARILATREMLTAVM